MYIVDDHALFGFHLDAWENAVILNWMEARVSAPMRTAVFRLHAATREQISILTSEQIGGDWQTEFAVLTPTLRADMPEREIITLGGIAVTSGMVANQVAEFNLRSHTHQIEIVEYRPIGYAAADWDAARARFFMDIMSGQGPDIIWDVFASFSPLIEAGVLLDLYTFLDADPELYRSMFFPNILSLAEAQDGSLVMMPYAFRITTWVGMGETVGNIESWTFSQMRIMVEQAADENMNPIATNGIGMTMSAWELLMNALRNSDSGFIDWTENTADLDNEDFIDFLELIANLPHDPAGFSIDSHQYSAARMQSGEQLLSYEIIDSVNMYQMYRFVFGEDMVFIGYPSRGGGAHSASFPGISINASSAHPEAAWQFIRQFLMPDLDLNPWLTGEASIPLRIDELEAQIEDAMTPRFETDARGNQVEVPRRHYSVNLTRDVPLYAMTEAQAREFRSIIESVNRRWLQNAAVEDIIQEELLPFLAGNRSAADTARIMQNRVQTFLWERG